MNINATVREFLSKRSFRPFRIEMVDGHIIHIPHPDFVALPPHATDRFNPVFYYFRKDGTGVHINPMMVARIVPESGKRLAKSRTSQ
jgi:hypothetical protein